MDAKLCNASKSADVGTVVWKLKASSHFLKEMCRLLLQSLCFTHKKMDPELYRAAASGDVEAVMSKLDASFVAFLQTTPQGDTLFHISARSGHEELVKQLLFMLTEGSREFLISVRVVSLSLFGRSSFLRVENAYGNTALHEAAKASHAGVISTILQHDKGMAAILNRKGEKPLSLACTNGNLEAIQAFLDDKRFHYVNNKRKDGQTCLHFAALRGSLELVKLLVEGSKQGMQCLQIDDSFGATPLHSAVDGGNTDVVEYILQKSPDLAYTLNALGRAPIHLAALKGDIQMIKTIVKERPDCIDMQCKEGKTILHFAVQSHELGLVKWISRQHYYRFWGDEPDRKGNLPLHLAALYFADEQMVKTLLNSFARPDVNAVNKKGFTCLDLVCLSKTSCERSNEVETCLRKAGAFTAEDVRERDVLNTPAEQRERYSRMNETMALIATLFAMFAVTERTDGIQDPVSSKIYLAANNVLFYSSMGLIVVWILLEPLSRPKESSWIHGSIYVLGFMVVAAGTCYYIVITDRFGDYNKPDADSWFALQWGTSSVVLLGTVLWILGRMVWSYYKAKGEHKEYVGVTIKRMACRLFTVTFTGVLLDLIMLQFLANDPLGLVGIVFLLFLFMFSHRMKRIVARACWLVVFALLVLFPPFWVPIPTPLSPSD